MCGKNIPLALLVSALLLSPAGALPVLAASAAAPAAAAVENKDALSAVPSARPSVSPATTGPKSKQNGRAPAASLQGNSVTLPEAVQRALRDSPVVAASKAGSSAAEEGRKSALSSFGPRLGMSYSVNKVRQETTPRTGTRHPEYGTYTWNVDISQPVFTGFNLLSTYQKAALEADRQKASLRNTQLSLTEQVQTYFLEYLRARENVRSAEDSLARLQDQLKITQAFYSVGLRPRLEVLQAEVDVNQAENVLIQTENNRDITLTRLNTLLGLNATAEMHYRGELEYTAFTMGLEACLEKAYRQRPDLYMARKAVEIAEKDRKIVQSDFYPKIDAYYNISNYGNNWELQIAGEDSSRSTRWEVGLQATWNVFEWGKTFFADQQAGYNVTRVRHEETNLKLEAGYDVKSKLLALHESEKRIIVAKKGMEQSTEAYNQALARYQAQVGTNFDVLNASAKLTAAEAALTGAKADYLTALSSLYVAMGELHPDLMAQK